MRSQVILGDNVQVVYQNTYAGFGSCRYCNRAIHWSAMPNGRRIALDATEHEDVFTPHNDTCAAYATGGAVMA
jgi:hypothetical protein